MEKKSPAESPSSSIDVGLTPEEVARRLTELLAERVDAIQEAA